MEQIKGIVKDVIERLSSKTSIPQKQIWRVWQEAVGEKNIKHTRIEGIRDGRIFVRVDSPVLMFHLNLKRNYILKQLQQRIDRNLTDIKLKIGKIR
jgi:predicted nucleic acid-binding Zn ribbon protein